MNNNIIVTLKSSTTEMNLNSHEEGIYLIPDLEGLTSIPEIRTSSGVNAGADGGWTSAQFFDARSIAMKVVISNEDVSVVEQKRQALNSLLAQGRKEDLLLTVVTEAGNAYTVYVRPTSVSSALNQVLKAQEMLIQFRADDPLIYGEGSSGGEEAILHVQQALGGFAIPFKFPLAIGGGSGATTITNSGSESVYPIITLEGPLHSPTVINRTTNQQIQVLVDLASIINWAGEETAQGNYIQVNNQLDIPTALKSAELLGDATQTTYSGKNLFNIKSFLTDRGVSYTENSDGSVTFGLTQALHSTPFQFSNTDVMVSIQALITNVTSTNAYIELYKSDGTSRVARLSQTVQKAENVAASKLSFNWGTAGNVTVKNAQLELGSTATTYEPYVGGTASPNPDYPQAVNTVTGEQTVKIEGKNLFDTDTAVTRFENIGGSQVNEWGTYQNGIVTVVKSNGAFGVCAFAGFKPTLIEGETYTLSADVYISGSNSGSSLRFGMVQNSGTAFSTPSKDAWNRITKTFVATATDIADSRVAIQAWNTGNTVQIKNIQLELGSTATAYEPYQRQALAVNLGKNLFNQATATQNYRLGSTGEPFADDNYYLSDFISVAQNIAYYISGTSGTPESSAICFYASDKSFISRRAFVNDWYRFTTPANTAFLRFTTLKRNDIDSVQLEKGSQATDFAPYFTPIELAKIGDYQDYIFNDNGTWKIHKAVGKVVLDGTNADITWNLTTQSEAYCFWYRNITMGALDARYEKLCDKFAYSPLAFNNGAPTPSLCENQYGANILTIFKTDGTQGTTVADWKTWLGTHPTTVYYPLATPTDTVITNTTLIAQLNALMDAQLYVGTNNVSTSSEYVPAILDISFFTEYTRSIDKVVIDSQLQTVTLNGLDIYHQLSESSEFITIAPGDNEMILTSTNTSDEGIATIKFKQGYLSI